MKALPDQRAIIDRRAVADRLAGLRTGQESWQRKPARFSPRRSPLAGRKSRARLADEPGNGRAAAQATAFLHDQLVRLAYDFVCERMLDAPDRRDLALVGLGGTGRGEMAPFSDLDLMFLTRQGVPTPEQERAAEAMLAPAVGPEAQGRPLGPLGSAADRARQEGHDHPHRLPRSALAVGRAGVFDLAMRRFRKEVVAGTAAEFVAAKLAERDQRHIKMGDSRYVVEPNVKDGKGGLRDLHTLYWIGKYVHGVERPADLVKAGLLTAAEFRRFDRAERFFWSVRCHLHLLAGRAEERLNFDYQPRIAEIMHYADRPGKSAVERFMQFYFLNAKTVGDLTGVFLAQLDEQLGEERIPLRASDDPPPSQASRRLHAGPRPHLDSVGRLLP